jgi:hypothetical protein
MNQKKGGEKFSKSLRLELIAGIIFCLGAYFPFTGVVQAVAPDHIVINEIQTDSIAGAGGTEDDWVELYNPTSATISLDGWSIQKTSGTFASLARKELTGTIPAGGHFLIVRDSASTSPALINAADVSASSFPLTDNSVVYLVNDNNNIATTTDQNIVDFVGFGSSTIFEGSGPAANPADAKSIARAIDGQDTNNNSADFSLQNNPSPENSGQESEENDIGGTVLLTITKDAAPEQNITPTGADIVFEVNGAGNAVIYYGLGSSYGSTTVATAFLPNAQTIISLAGLSCNTIYHYSIYAANTAGSDSDITSDVSFTTGPCGIALNSLSMTKISARANNQYADGWEWTFNITVWDINETNLKMKFNQWTGAGVLNAGNNMQFSVDSGSNWLDITANDAYPAVGADISGIDNNVNNGRQVEIKVRMKVPVGTYAGDYNSSYGILTE